jgi:hypothetical protein
MLMIAFGPLTVTLLATLSALLGFAASRENGKKGGRPPSPNPVRPRKKR